MRAIQIKNQASGMKNNISNEKFDPLSDSIQLIPTENPEEVAGQKLSQLQYRRRFKKLFQKQQKAKYDYNFWNAMVEGRLQSMSSITNLFILLLIITLGGQAYNGVGTKGGTVLGWICVAQVCFFYLLTFALKIFYLPHLQQNVAKLNNDGLNLFHDVYKRKRQINSIEDWDKETLLETCQTRENDLRRLAPKSDIDAIVHQVGSSLKSDRGTRDRTRAQIKNLKKKESSSKYWQQFWQGFIYGKTYTIPGVILLLFIITCVSIGSVPGSSVGMNNAQGWISVGIWVFCIIVFIIIITCLWKILDRNVENSRTVPFTTYYPVYLKHKQLKSLSLPQLEDLKTTLTNRPQQFSECFPEANTNQVLINTQNLVSERLPLKKSEQEQVPIKQMVEKQKDLKINCANWTNFFNKYMVPTIINILKFLIVMALSWQNNYPTSADGVRNAQIAIGSIGIGCFVFGYIFYAIMRCCIIEMKQNKVLNNPARPFLIYRLVYFGNKKLQDLKAHELDDINIAINERKQQFEYCFPNTNISQLQGNIIALLNQRQGNRVAKQSQHELLKKQVHERQMFNFWTMFADGPMLSAIYSIYVLLVLLIVSIVAGNAGASAALGWVGVAVIATLILVVLIVKCIVLEHMDATLKSMKIEGVSEYYLVYINSKPLSSVQTKQLQLINKMIVNNPTEFHRCFPNANMPAIQNQIQVILSDRPKPLSPHQIPSILKVELQELKLDCGYRNYLKSQISRLQYKIENIQWNLGHR